MTTLIGPRAVLPGSSPKGSYVPVFLTGPAAASRPDPARAALAVAIAAQPVSRSLSHPAWCTPSGGGCGRHRGTNLIPTHSPAKEILGDDSHDKARAGAHDGRSEVPDQDMIFIQIRAEYFQQQQPA